MKAYIDLKPHGSAESVELSSVAPSLAWFPEEPPEPPPLEPAEEGPAVPVEDGLDEFFWQELTEDEISERQGGGAVGLLSSAITPEMQQLTLRCEKHEQW